MTEHGVEGGEWTGCVHCGQRLPHQGTSWHEAYRCRLFQRIAEQAWDKGVIAAHRSDLALFAIKQVNPYRPTPPASTQGQHVEGEGK